MKVTARQDREPIVDGILSGWKPVKKIILRGGFEEEEICGSRPKEGNDFLKAAAFKREEKQMN